MQTDLLAMQAGQVDVVITHWPFDYEIGPARCIGNPAGYAGESRWCRGFRPDLVVEI